jgi:hypothetical protein
MTDDAKPIDLIGYEALYLDAMRGLIRKALERAASPQGLPGEHHFYITFVTRAAGVVGPPEVLARFPDEMTIVLQHQFWDLAVGESEFSVTLSFSGQPKRFAIPYSAISMFRDPAAPFQLQLAADLPPAAEPPAADTPPPVDGADKTSTIVALDAFRKKR